MEGAYRSAPNANEARENLEATVHDIIKQLSKLTAREVQELDDLALRRLAVVCHRCDQLARAEIVRRKSASR